jgi:hypothetical protein
VHSILGQYSVTGSPLFVLAFWTLLILLAIFGWNALARRTQRKRQENRTTPESKTDFPKPRHGAFVMLLGTFLSWLKCSGALGSARTEGDLQTGLSLLLGGIILGTVLLTWSYLRSRQ